MCIRDRYDYNLIRISYGYDPLCSNNPFDPAVKFILRGANCFDQGVIKYRRSCKSYTKIFLVKPDTAYAHDRSLVIQKVSSDSGTSRTIIDGLNCSMVSRTDLLYYGKVLIIPV